MPFNWRKALKAIIQTALIVLFYGGFLFLLFLFGSLGAFPVYVTKVIPFVGIATMLALVLAASGYLGGKALKWLKRATLAVCALTLVYMAWGAYTESIPTVDDRAILLHEYDPFVPESRRWRKKARCNLAPQRLAASVWTAQRRCIQFIRRLYRPFFRTDIQVLLMQTLRLAAIRFMLMRI